MADVPMFNLNTYSSNDNKATVPVNQLDMFDKQMHDYKMKTDKGYRQVEEFKANANNQALEDSFIDPLTMFVVPYKTASKLSRNNAIRNMTSPTKNTTHNFTDDVGTKYLDDDISGQYVYGANSVVVRGNKNDLGNYATLRHEMKHADNEMKGKGYDYVSPEDDYHRYRSSREEMSATNAEMKAFDTAIDIAREQGDRRMFNKLVNDRQKTLYDTFLSIHRNPEEILPFHNDFINKNFEKDFIYKKPTLKEQLLSMDL